VRAHAVFAGEDSLNNRDHCLVLLRRLRSTCGFLVCGYDIREQIAHVAFVDNFEVGQREKERLADAKSGRASESGN
jgi:hypothetical protein